MVDFFSQYAWVKHLIDNKAKAFLCAFNKMKNKYNRESNELWVDPKERSFAITLSKNGKMITIF